MEKLGPNHLLAPSGTLRRASPSTREQANRRPTALIKSPRQTSMAPPELGFPAVTHMAQPAVTNMAPPIASKPSVISPTALPGETLPEMVPQGEALP